MPLPKNPPNINPNTFLFQHHLGIFKKGIKIENPKREIVAFEKVRFCKDESGNQVLGSFQCAKVERTGQVTLIAPEHVINQVCLVHDCSTGNCHFKESETTVTVEREAVQKVTYNFVHNSNHHYYLVNKFYLGDESLKYFNIS
jgi:hypothetical protein